MKFEYQFMEVSHFMRIYLMQAHELIENSIGKGLVNIVAKDISESARTGLFLQSVPISNRKLPSERGIPAWISLFPANSFHIGNLQQKIKF